MLKGTANVGNYGAVSTRPTRNPANYMNFKFYDSDLEQKFRAYCDETGQPMNKVVNDAIQGLFSIDVKEPAGRVERLQFIVDIYNHVNWDEFDDLLQKIHMSPLSRNATLADLVLGIIAEGVSAYRQRYALKGRPHNDN